MSKKSDWFEMIVKTQLGRSLCLSPMRMMFWVHRTEIWNEGGLYD